MNKHCWCGGDLQRFHHPEYGQCAVCGTVVALALRTDDALRQFYSQKHYWHEYQKKAGNYPDITARSHSDFLDRIPVWYSTLKDHKPNFDSILEIGCSHGGFLEFCRRYGASTVVGVEVDAETCAFAKDRFMLQHVYTGLFPDVDLPYKRFDVVCGFDVIEHFTDPVLGLRRMAELLNNDGVIFVQTPFYNGDDDNWPHLKPDEHLFLFGEESLRRLFAVCGLEIIALTPGYFSGDCFVLARKMQIKNILFIRTDTIGDSVLASSLLPYLKATYPDAVLSVLCQQHIAELYESSPCITHVIPFDFWQAYRNESYRNLIVKKIGLTQPDLVLNSQFSRELLNEYFTLASGGKQIVGMYGDTSEIDEQTRNANNLLYTWLIPSPAYIVPELERHACFLRGLGVSPGEMRPEVWLTEEDDLFADKFCSRYDLESHRTVALFPAGRHWQKYYPRYAEALDPVCRENNLQLLLLGGKGDQELLESLSGEFSVRTVSCSGTLTLRQMAALLKRCRLAVGADTGTAHIACAVGTPNVVVLWGGHFGRFFPYSPLTSVACLPLECYGCNWQCPYERWHCVADLQPEVLSAAVIGALDSVSNVPRMYLQAPDSWIPIGTEPKWEMFERFVDYRNVEIIPVE